MNTNTFAWLLIAFPAYLLLRGRFTQYLQMAAQSMPKGDAKPDDSK